MQYDLETTDASLDLFGSAKSKLIDNKITKNKEKPFLLMLRASTSAKNFLTRKNIKTVTIFIGKGNNGEDGLCLAALLKIENVETHVVDLEYKERLESQAFRLCVDLGVKVERFNAKKIPKSDWYVDAIFGIGLNRDIKGDYLIAINFLQRSGSKKILSLDLPSGLDGSKGVIFNSTVKATTTITFLTIKPGLFIDKACDYTGVIYFDDLGIDKLGYKPDMQAIGKETIHISDLTRSAHKGERGSILCLGGSNSMEGAGILAGISALRSGGGKIFWASNTDKLQRPPELIHIKPTIDSIKAAVDKNMSTAIIGPGLGKNFDKEIEFLWKSKIKIILDADGLDWLSRKKPKKRAAAWVGTPHIGEMKKLLKDDFSDKWSNIINLKKHYGGDWILKGPGTLVSEDRKLWLNLYSNGWLGTAGMGDVLAGIIAGLWASGSNAPFRSAVFLQTECAKNFLRLNNGAGLTASNISELIGTSIGSFFKNELKSNSF
ncbi:NAD(P)H-hydrate epimerase [Paracoccaceae bacterium]|nr:NAD(P)H-hydrate epimerase [Paracoccaceae bacterium]